MIAGFLLSGLGRKLLLYAGLVFAVLAVLFGFYRAGARAEKAAQERRAFRKMEETHNAISDAEDEISRTVTSDDLARDWLRKRAR